MLGFRPDLAAGLQQAWRPSFESIVDLDWTVWWRNEGVLVDLHA